MNAAVRPHAQPAGPPAGTGATASLDALLHRAATQRPDGPAIGDGERTLTYAELETGAARLASLLADHGVSPGDRVGLLLDKSLEAVIALYAILRAGATYVPLDPDAPATRLGYILRDAGIAMLVSEVSRAPVWPELMTHGAPLRAIVVAADDAPPAPAGVQVLPWNAIDAYAAADPAAAGPERLAYVLYTSGSTGEPKGVMLSHRAGLAFVEWAARETGLSPHDRLSSHAPLYFDLSTFDLFGAACAAAAVLLVPRAASVFPLELARFIREQRISVWYSVPSILTQLVLRGDLGLQPPGDLRTVIFAGEVFPSKYLRALMDLLPQARFLNFFGPTETNVCTWYEVPRDLAADATLPIGRAIDGVSVRLEREDGSEAPPGAPGELVITGPSVMHGYWGDPVRSARVLTRHDGSATYRTGDLARRRPDGELEFLGRRDAQVKTRGYRVELGEVEAALNALPEVVECAVVAIPDETITNRLCAYVVTTEPMAAGQLRAACAARLPRYMIPEQFVARDGLPKSPTGKIDRRSLAEGRPGG